MPWPTGVPRPEETRRKIGEAKDGRPIVGRRYQMRPCRVCGASFRGRGSTHCYCSKECKAIANYEAKSAVTDVEYRLLFDRQGGRCAICESPESGGPKTHKRFYADHDHNTGAVRGLLCLRCNMALGNFGDDPKRLLRAAAYVAGGIGELNRLAIGPLTMSAANTVCRTCGKAFHAKPSVIANGGGVFCSRDCAHRARWGRPHPGKGVARPERWPAKSAACATCGETFQYRGNPRKYCSRPCYVQSQKGKPVRLVG